MNSQKEIKKYTRYTQLLNGVATIAGVILIILFFLEPSRLTNSAWVIWLLIVIAGMHTFEEYTWPGGFIKWFNGSFFRSNDLDKPLSTKMAFWTDATAAVVMMGILAIIGTNYLWLSLGFICIVMINGAWHLTSTITSRVYSPGSVTSAVFNIPLGAYVLYFYTNNGFVGLTELTIAYAIGIVVHIAFFKKMHEKLDRK